MMERCLDQPGAQRVDAYAALEPFDGCGLRHADHRMFRADIQRCVFETDHTAHRRIVDDTAVALLQHHFRFVLHAVEDAADVRFEHHVEAFAVLFDQRRKHALGAGVVERDVELAVRIHREFHHRGDVFFLRHIDDDRLRFTARGRDRGDHFVQSALTTRCSDNLRAALCEDDGRCLADSRTRARDEGDLAFQLTAVSIVRCTHDSLQVGVGTIDGCCPLLRPSHDNCMECIMVTGRVHVNGSMTHS